MKLTRMMSALGLSLLVSAGTVDAVLQSAIIWDAEGSCTSSPQGVPAIVTTTDTGAAACAPFAAACSGSWPFTQTKCPNAYSDVIDYFSTSPYVSITLYTGDTACANAETNRVAYLADGVCHKTGTAAATSYFKAVVNQDGSATVKTYTNAACTLGVSVVGSLTSAQTSGTTCVTVGSNGIKAIVGTAKTALTITSTYETKDSNNCGGASDIPSDWTASYSGATPCSESAACSDANWPFLRTKCPTTTYDAAVTTAFGSNPYVTVYSYAGTSCTDFTGVKTYMADGVCHKTGTALATSYFKAVVNQDGSATVKTYTDAACTAGAIVVASPTVAQLTAGTGISTSTCITGSGDTYSTVAVVSSAQTAIALTATATYDSKDTDNCTSTRNLTDWTAVFTGSTTCTTTASCATATAWPYTRVMACNDLATYDTQVKTAFGTIPYVTVYTYASGANCTSTDLTGVKTYVADGVCHTTGSTMATSYFKAVVNQDGSAVVKTYTDAACTAGAIVVASPTVAQGTGTTCVNGTVGANIIKTVVSTAKTATALSATATFDSSTVCTSAGVPAQWSLSPALTTCTASTACSAAAPWRTSCTSLSTYSGAVATAFSSTPYVIVESYAAGQQCSPTDLTGVVAYVADGKCHVTGTSTSIKALANSDGSVVVRTYTDSACTTGTFLVRANLTQLQKNDCSAGPTGVKDMKVFASTAKTPGLLTTTATFDSRTDCASSTGVPALWSIAPPTTTCTSTACTTAAPFQLTSCTSLSTYKGAIATAFSATPFVIVESYASGQQCSQTDLTGVMTYMADGKCHVTGTRSSFKANVTMSGAVSVMEYTASAACDDTTAKTTLTAASSQTRGNSCANDANGLKDKLVYAMSPRYLSVVVKYDAAACSGPAQVTIANATTCNPASCVTAGQGSVTYDCVDDSYAYAGSLYKTTSYVVAEVYAANTNCSTLQGLVAYAADAKCHVALDQSSSFMVTLPTDGSAQISLYNGLNCTGASSSVVAVAAAQLTAHTCVGNAKYYGFKYTAPTVAPVMTTATPTTTPDATTATPATTTATPANQQSGNASPSLFASMSTMVAASLAWVMLLLVWDP